MKRLVFDLDQTLCIPTNSDYVNAKPCLEIIERLREYKRNGFEIIISSSRNVKTFNCNLGKINAKTLPVILEWLDRHNVPYDEVYVGKPWCGEDGFYIDDRAIRPDEFIRYSFQEIQKLIGPHK